MDVVRFLKKAAVVRFAALSAVAGVMVGCASQAQPNFIGGQYYMAGDDDCKYTKHYSKEVISCFNSASVFKGFRFAMTTQELQMYQYQQFNQQLQMQQLSQQMQQTGQAFQQAGQQSLQQSQQYIAPQVAPIQSPDSGQIKCINAGIYTNCRY